MEQPAPSATISLPLRTLALSSVLVALAALATLVVVVSVKGVDALSTLAIALAVLAFVVQLIVFIVQAADVSRQTARGQELHAQMMTVLAQIQERTQGTQQSVDRMNTKLLEAVISKAAGEGLTVGSSEFAERLLSGLSSRMDRTAEGNATVSDLSPAPGSPDPIDYPGPLPGTEAAATHLEMRTWPEPERLSEIQALTSPFTDREWNSLYRYSHDLLKSTRPNAPIGPGLPVVPGNKLVDYGLLEKIPGWKLSTLSEKGRLVGRLLTAEGNPPPEFAVFAEQRKLIEGRIRVGTTNRE